MSRKFLAVLTICLFGVAQFFTRVEAGPELGDEQIQNIPHHSRNRDSKYRFVSLKTSTRRTRELRPVEIEINGTKTQLKLTPVEYNVIKSDISVWIVQKDTSITLDRSYHKLSQEETVIDGTYYEDIRNMALMLAQYKNHQIYYDGVLGEGTQTKVVEKIPEKWWHEIPKESDHVIYDVNQNVMDTEHVQLNGVSDELMDKPLEVMYPKLLIVLENNFFKQLGENVAKAIKYVSTFWNAVNLKYRNFSKPQVKIVITGIIIEKDEYTLPYISMARNQTNRGELNTDQMLLNTGQYFKEEFHKELNFKNYDSIFIMTNLNSDTEQIVGRSWEGKICSDALNNGYIRDDGIYAGVRVAIHELGHLLNLPHDGYDEAKNCESRPDEDTATVMAPVRFSKKKLIWSDCSKKILQQFAWMKAAECMRNSFRH